MTRWPTPSQVPNVNFGSDKLREPIISSQGQTTSLEIPRPNQEMCDFLRQTAPSPTADDGGGLASGAATSYEFSMASAGHSRSSSMEVNAPCPLGPPWLRQPPSQLPTAGDGGELASGAAVASYELRASFLTVARNRRIPFPAGLPSFGRQPQQSPAKDVDMGGVE